MRKFIKWVYNCWQVVMDSRFSPLRFIADPSIAMYFTLVLFTMWSVYFGFVAVYYMGWLGYSIPTSIIVNLAVLITLFMTHAIFLDAERDGSKWLKDIKKEMEGDK